jgi:excisionase family DNA binding protein
MGLPTRRELIDLSRSRKKGREKGGAMMEEIHSVPAVFSRVEAARLAKVGLSTLDELIKQRRFPVIQMGRRKLIPAGAFARFLQGESNG